jgi:hypothetical protein
MKRHSSMILMAVLTASACSRSDAPLSSGVTGPGSDVAEPGRTAIVGAQGVSAVAANCTLTQGFWKNHEEDWPVASLTLGAVTYTKAQALAILRTPPRGDATYILIHQLIAATLNVASGADASAVSIADANAWLTANPLGSKPKGAARDQGIALADTLDAYNNGVIGPGHCGEATPTPVPTATPTPTSTPTPTPTPTLEPTPTPTEEPDQGFRG